MAISNSIADFKMQVHEKFVQKAVALEPQLYQVQCRPEKIVRLQKQKGWQVAESFDVEKIQSMALGKGDHVCLDFGKHLVGYFSFQIASEGSPADAPAYLRIKFGETCDEIGEDTKNYRGNISSSWLQEEFLHVDEVPATVSMPRRYSFRYVEIMVLDTSPKYKIKLEELSVMAVTAADYTKIKPLKHTDGFLRHMDEVGIRTLGECMQKVFEDGPKRDRRLWLGDLRLQAQVNYVTFKNYDLVKRCLYLFAGLTQNEGRVGANLFIAPHFQVDDTYLFDYALLFVSCLYDYYCETKERDVLEELWDTAYRQIEIAAAELDEKGVIADKDTWWCFLDWKEGLNKQAGAQAIFIYTLKQAVYLAKELGKDGQYHILEEYLERATDGAIDYLWDETQQFFVSGHNRQISWASQIWFVLAGVFEKWKNAEILRHLIAEDPEMNIVTPYMYHYFVQALLESGLKEEAFSYMNAYWGGMLRDGADCYYELYDPQDPEFSPYGSKMIHSYCHAWSCTPSYFIRKYFC